MPFGKERRSSAESVERLDDTKGTKRRTWRLSLKPFSSTRSSASSLAADDVVLTPDSQNYRISSHISSIIFTRPDLIPPLCTDQEKARVCITHWSLSESFEVKVATRNPSSAYEASYEASELHEKECWKSTLLNPGTQSRRNNAIEELNRRYRLEVCRRCWEDSVEFMELFSVSTLFVLEFLNYASLYVNDSHFGRIRARFVAESKVWRNYTLVTIMARFSHILAIIEDAILQSIEPVVIMHGADSWNDIIKGALAHDMEEFSQILLKSITKTELLQLTPSGLQSIVDAVQLAIRYCDIGIRAFDRFLQMAAQTLGILPSLIVIPGIKRLGDDPVHGGGFADVWKGEFEGHLLALKVLRIFSKADNDKMLAVRWTSVKKPRYGTDSTIQTWMENGDLSSFIRRRDIFDCRKMIKGVACGLCYLHNLKPKLVHGDLRAANVVIDDNLEPRITDFGLARVIDSQSSTIASSFRGRGTLRWQAPELLNATRFKGMGEPCNITAKSDVYAFACLCLEVFTGEVPFSNLVDGAVILEVAVHDRRPPKPDSSIASRRGLTAAYWDMMQLCWRTLPTKRPEMSWVVEWLEVEINESVENEREDFFDEVDEDKQSSALLVQEYGMAL
ncbi:kinase-like domain-containing protein [Phellopilus nigrolimitatus]|nr:kinase-like domain-containing protein [Phellopilus nigrolimitatus]